MKPITNETVLSSARLAGNVLRYHTWPTIQQQTLADHTFHCIRIYSQIFGPPSPEVTVCLIWHDLGEIKLGDIPYPCKANNYEFKVEADKIEDEGRKALGAPQVFVSEKERKLLKVVDLIEMLEFGFVEKTLGNAYADPIIRNMQRAISELSEKFLSELNKRLVFNFLLQEGLLEDHSG